MHYHVARDGQQLGRVPEAELRAGLSDGRYLFTDLGWAEGMAEWTPLGTLLNVPDPAATPTPGDVPASPHTRGPASVPAFAPGAGPMGYARVAPQHVRSPYLGPAESSSASGLAITSLIVGILSFVVCGLGGVGTVVSIICGHMALGRIRRSGGLLPGKGMAVTGLIFGYLSILSLVAVGVSLAIPFFTAVQEKSNALQGKARVLEQIDHAQTIQAACLTYALKHEGKYPPTLEAMVQDGVIAAELFQKATALKPPGWEGEPGFDYHGAGLEGSVPPETEILVSRARGARGQRVVAYADGSATLVESGEE